MKLLHIADLHIGKRVNGFSLIEDQRYILDQIITQIQTLTIDGLIIAGDVYDKRTPTAEAVLLLDAFLTRLSVLECPVFMIGGNHDSPERLGFGSDLLKRANLYISGRYDGTLKKIELSDAHGIVHIHLLPFVKPALLTPFFETRFESYDDAIRTILSHADINPENRNILVAHQFITAGGQPPERSDSEILSLGGVDNVDVSAFDIFDYVALGHIHRPQRIGRDTVRYAGSPLKYSFSEARHLKTLTCIELGAKGDLKLSYVPLKPLHDMREIRGPLAALVSAAKNLTKGTDDYIRATLTDETPQYDALGKLRAVYPNLMTLDFDNTYSRTESRAAGATVSESTPLELFTDFYEMQNGTPMTSEALSIITQLFEGGADETD